MAELGFQPGTTSDRPGRGDGNGSLSASRTQPKMRAHPIRKPAIGAAQADEPVRFPHSLKVDFSGVIVLFGAPGSGKGSEGALLTRLIDVPHISTGELLRDFVKQQTPLAQEVAGVMDRGELVSDELMIRVLIERSASEDCKKGFILDGFPRKLSQVEAFTGMLTSMQRKLQAVINLDVEDEIAVRRILNGNRGRADDADPSTVRSRIRTFREQTLPVLNRLRAIAPVISVIGNGTIAATHELILPRLPIHNGRWIDSAERPPHQ